MRKGSACLRQHRRPMKRLSARRLEKVIEFLQQTYRAQDLDEFANTVPSAPIRLIDADISTTSTGRST